MVFYAPPRSRLVHLLIAVAAAFGTAWVVMQPDGPPTAATVVVGMFLVYIGVRGTLMAVVCEPAHIRVRGLVYSRSIPIDAITSISHYPAVRWKGSTGKWRWTPISALMPGPTRRSEHYAHSMDSVEEIRSWINANRSR